MSLNWRLRAACKVADPELFFPIQGDNATPDHCREALDYCHRCEVTEECLNLALAKRANGVWGGLTESQRIILLRQDRVMAAAASSDSGEEEVA